MGDPPKDTNEGGGSNNPPPGPHQNDDENQYPSRDNFKVINKYDIEMDRGPFFVFVQSKDSTLEKYHPMSFGKQLYTKLPNYKHGILGISALGKKKIRIELSTAKAANNLVDEKEFMESAKIEMFIPYFHITKQGIIRDIPIDLTCEELYHDIVSPHNNVIKVKRFVNRTTKEIKNSILVTFRGQILPDYIVIHSVRTKVTPFIPPVILCLNCVRYGHSNISCKTKQRCPRCLGPHPVISCQSSEQKACIYCKNNDHTPLEKDKCPEFQKQIKIKKLMTMNNYSFLEAKDHVNYNPYSNLLNVPKAPINFTNPINFPPLRKNTPAINHHPFNNNKSIKRVISSDSNDENDKICFNNTRNTKKYKPNEQKKTFGSATELLYSNQDAGPSQPLNNNPYPPQYHRLIPATSKNIENNDQLIELLKENPNINMETCNLIKNILYDKSNYT